MPLLHLIIIAVVQGITEFLPISSSAHLILVPKITGWQDQGLVIDVAVHLGSLLAVLVYFRKDVQTALRGGQQLLMSRRPEQDRLPGTLARNILVATVPAIVAGAALAGFGVMDQLRSVALIGWTTLVFGVFLYLADRFAPAARPLDQMTFAGALWIGLAQVLALVPGTSRSGITMTAGRALGFDRQDTARFSMLLSIPTILGAGALETAEVLKAGQFALGLDALLALMLSFISALCAIALLMAWLRRSSFTPFAVYRVLLGLALLGWAYLGG